MLVLLNSAGFGATGRASSDTLPDRVIVPALDGPALLVGYVFKPQGAGPHPAVVMMHGRAGAYSSRAKGQYGAATLSKRHQYWGALWAAQGYLALLVDGFGPRGYPQGFGRGSYKDRPDAVNEVTVRPRDAAAALAYLRARSDVLPDRIGLQGWSNGGSAALVAMADGGSDTSEHDVIRKPLHTFRHHAPDFRGALVFYPGCGLKGQFDDGIKPSAPVRVLMGEADDEVSPKRCASFVAKSRARGGDITLQLYPGATHGFDDPSAKRASVSANAAAARDAIARAIAFFADVLKP